MLRRSRAARHTAGFHLAALVALAAIPLALAVAASDRVHFEPKFTQGETLRYRVETRTTTTGKSVTPIANPEGESKVSQKIDLLVRLDVFGVERETPGVPQKVRFNAIFEQSASSTDRDALNPDAPSPDEQFARLQGHSVQFTMGPAGDLSDFQGTGDLIANPSDADPEFSWVKSLSIASRFPREGISLGQKWNEEKPLTGLPLADLTWRTESTYVRNEACSPAAALGPDSSTAGAGSTQPGAHPAPEASKNASVASDEMCAIILTRYEISSRRSDRSDATPEEYLRHGLRTSGSWTGSGESLDSISLSSGLLVSSTQTGTQDIDYEIANTTSKSRIHNTGHVETQSQINLITSSQGRP